jgi:hypothetical protein
MPPSLLITIDRYLRRTGMPRTRFGREACGDPNLVGELARGREPGDRLVRRISTFIDGGDNA